MYLLNNTFALVATASLTIQIAVLLLLIYGYSLKRQQKFRQHGVAMFSALVLHLSMVFGIMVPSFVLAIFPEFIVPDVYGVKSVVTLVMAATGALTVSLGLWLVVSWRFHDVEGCFARKKFMLWTITFWFISLFLGIMLYAILYWPV